MKKMLSPEWRELLEQEFSKPYWGELSQFVQSEYDTQTIFPAKENIFRALELCPPDRVRVVIVGQDPYHGDGQANGLSFSVNDGVAIPPSLRNIFKEIGDAKRPSGNLDRWASQGVLLLNSVLTVRSHTPASHSGRGWEQFTDAVVGALAANKLGIIYMLWGSYAQKKGSMVDPARNYILKSTHPSPLSAYRGFLGCNHFSLANQYLARSGEEEIDW